jgi:hypothetical protein
VVVRATDRRLNAEAPVGCDRPKQALESQH